jgi:hypothetical protein
LKKQSKIVVIAAILLLASPALITALPFANAHSPAWNIPTYAYCAVSPQSVGVGQYVQILMWLNTVVPTSGGLGGDRWRGFTVSVTKPDGTKQSLGPFESEQVGSQYTIYTPDQVGNYTFVFSWPGQTLALGGGTPDNVGVPYVGDFFMPSTSSAVVLPVTQNPTASWQEPPVPTGYWTLPINAANRQWSMLASNWLKGSWLVGNWQTEGQAPNSPHILWQKPITAGGIADAQWPGVPYNADDYESPWSAPIIMNGIIYYNTPQTATTARYGFYALDLYTGKQLWYNNNTSINFPTLTSQAGGGGYGPNLAQNFPTLSYGQIYHYYSVNGQGALAYLWATSGSTWYMLDADTGNWILTLKNVPGGTSVVDQDGDLLLYSYNAATGNLLCWNSSQSIPPASPTGTAQQQWKPRIGATIDAVNDTSWTQSGPSTGAANTRTPWTAADITPRSGYTMNVTIQKGLPGSISRVLQDDNRVPRVILGTAFNVVDGSTYFTGGPETFSAWAVRIDYGVTSYTGTNTNNTNLRYGATLLWSKTFTDPVTGNQTMSLGPVSYDDGVWVLQAKESITSYGYSLTSGSFLWGPTPAQSSWDMYGFSGSAAYGNFYSCGYGGILYAYSFKTGNLLWTYSALNQGYESPYGNYPLSIGAIADGKVYLYSTEHSPTKPLWRGSDVRCIDASTGKELWKIQDYNMGLAVADGYLVSGNQYNNMIECYGKGPSATTVTTQTTVAPQGSSVLIQGTVTDQSPGAPGTPAIADNYMEQWMEYLYMQQAKPLDAKGVNVRLTTLDPNGNTEIIGNATTDLSGSYAIMWTPPVPGPYTIFANFDGTNSYGDSSAETRLGVAPAASPAPKATPATPNPTQTAAESPTPTQQTTAPTLAPTPSPVVPPPASGTPTMTYVAIVAVIVIIVAAAAVLILRRRK